MIPVAELPRITELAIVLHAGPPLRQRQRATKSWEHELAEEAEFCEHLLVKL